MNLTLSETPKTGFVATRLKIFKHVMSSNVLLITMYLILESCNLLYRGSYMSAHVLLNLLNELGKRDKMRGLPSILSLFSQRV